MRFDVRPAASGGWLALAAGPRLLVLPELDDAGAALEALAGPDGFRRAVDLLAAGGLTAMPPFVLVETTGEPRLIVRGEVSVTIEDAQGRREVDAASVSTWVEQVVPGLVAVEVSVPGAVDAIERSLPIREGVALAASLRAVVEASAPEEAPDDTEPQATAETPASAEPPMTAAAPASVESPPAAAPPVTTATSSPAVDAIPPHLRLARAVAPSPPSADGRIDAPPPPVEVDPHATVIGPFEVDPTTADPTTADPTTADPADPAAELASPSVPAPEPADDGYDYLFGETVFRSVSEAAVHEAGDDEVPAEPDAPRAGDHDGETIVSTDIAKLRAERKRGTPDASAAPAATPPSVVLPNGTRERLDQPLILGRSPSASQVTAGSIPKLITLGSGDQDISRSHVRFALEGGTVVVTDLHSVNGTSVVLPGRDPQRLRAGEPTAVIPGTVVDLGGGVILTVVED